MFGRKLRLFLIGLAALAVSAPVSAVEVDGKLPNYRKTKKKVSGTKTINNLPCGVSARIR